MTSPQTEDADPVAKIISIIAIDGGWSVKVRCPPCHRTHTHGGGSTDMIPMLWHRRSYCLQGGYVLEWTEASDR